MGRVSDLPGQHSPLERSERNDGDEQGRVRVHRVSDGAAIGETARAFTTRLAELQAAGLSLVSVFTLLRAYLQGGFVHLLRHSLEGIWPGELDSVVFQALQKIVDAPLDRHTAVAGHNAPQG